MSDIIKLLHKENCSCVIKNGNEIRTFSNRGVVDLYRLLLDDPGFLKGAFVADKVVGKAAASLMIVGGVKELYTGLISTPALEVLRKNGITVSFRMEVPAIFNRDKSDWCPLEKLCYHSDSLESNLDAIGNFLQNIVKP